MFPREGVIFIREMKIVDLQPCNYMYKHGFWGGCESRGKMAVVLFSEKGKKEGGVGFDSEEGGRDERIELGVYYGILKNICVNGEGDYLGLRVANLVQRNMFHFF